MVQGPRQPLRKGGITGSAAKAPWPWQIAGYHTRQFQTGAPFAMKDTSWDHALEVTAGGSGLVGHAGGILLRKLADQCGLTAALDGH